MHRLPVFAKLARSTEGQLRNLSVGILICIAAMGVSLSVYVGWREYQVSLQLEQARFDSDVESLAARLRDHLNEREILTRAVSAAFTATDPLRGALSSVDQRLLGFVPDAYSFVWAPIVSMADASSALAALQAADVANPQVLGSGGTPIGPEQYTDPLVLVLDILPKTPQNLMSLGLNLASIPKPRAALEAAATTGDVSATAPLQLVQLPGISALVMYAPIYARLGDPRTPVGYIGFSYRLDTLIGPVMSGRYAVRVIDIAADPTEHLIFTSGTWFGSGRFTSREVSFGGRPWRIEMQRPSEFGTDSARRGGIAGAIGLVIAAFILAALGFLLQLIRRLQRAEARLRVVNQELTHRIKNLFAVAQSIASQTFKNLDPDGEARNAYAGRMNSLTHGMALLSEGQWQGTDLLELVRTLNLPLSHRVELHGPAVFIGATTAQSLTLLLHELWTNACKHGALSDETGRVRLSWEVKNNSFKLSWTEVGKGPPDLNGRIGFGRTLVERLVPLQLNGQGKFTADHAGLVYELTAPLASLRN